MSIVCQSHANRISNMTPEVTLVAQFDFMTLKVISDIGSRFFNHKRHFLKSDLSN